MKTKNKQYNGHKNYNYWNVSLWINSDYGLCTYCRDLVREHGKDEAARIFIMNFSIGSGFEDKTPDGVKYNYSNVRAALVGMGE